MLCYRFSRFLPVAVSALVTLGLEELLQCQGKHVLILVDEKQKVVEGFVEPKWEKESGCIEKSDGLR